MKARVIDCNEYVNTMTGVMEAREKALKDAVVLNMPFFVWGPPGIGKSQILADLCKAKNWDFYDIRGSQLDPVDFRGMPIYDSVEEVAKFIRFSSILT